MQALAGKKKFKKVIQDHAKELGCDGFVNNMRYFQAKRQEIREANKKNKILKYLREQTIKKENEQKVKAPKQKEAGVYETGQPLDESPSRKVDGIDNLNIDVSEDNTRRDPNALDSIYKERKKSRIYNYSSVVAQGCISIYVLVVFFYSLYIK